MLRSLKKYCEDKWRKYFYGRSLSEKEGDDLAWRSEDGKNILPFIHWLKKNSRSGRVLDLGCGKGRQTTYFAKNGFETYGVDFSETAIRNAKQDAAKSGVSKLLNFTVGDALHLPYENEFFPIINDSGCFHHIAKKDQGLYVSEITRLLKPGGIFRLWVLNRKNEIFESRYAGSDGRAFLPPNGYTYFFKREEIENLFRKDFQIISFSEITLPQEAKAFFIIILEKRQ